MNDRDKIDVKSSVGCEETSVNRYHAFTLACNRPIAGLSPTVIKLLNWLNGVRRERYVWQSGLSSGEGGHTSDPSACKMEGGGI
jgi:hypothetical protein